MIFSPLQLNFPRPKTMQETRNFVNNMGFQAPSQQLMVMPQFGTNSFFHASQLALATSQSLQGPPQAMISTSNNAQLTRLPAQSIHQRKMEVSLTDGTRPYINLLDKPINNRF
ncbi:hypothetical protein CR513_46066, partial [Mucuna pruriens]